MEVNMAGQDFPFDLKTDFPQTRAGLPYVKFLSNQQLICRLARLGLDCVTPLFELETPELRPAFPIHSHEQGNSRVLSIHLRYLSTSRDRVLNRVRQHAKSGKVDSKWQPP
jgi:hypothetical protein